jgi:hypothetical protein
MRKGSQSAQTTLTDHSFGNAGNARNNRRKTCGECAVYSPKTGDAPPPGTTNPVGGRSTSYRLNEPTRRDSHTIPSMKLGWNELWMVRMHRASPPVKRLCHHSALWTRLRLVQRGTFAIILAVSLLLSVSYFLHGGSEPDLTFTKHPALSALAAAAIGSSVLMVPLIIGSCIVLMVLDARTRRRLQASGCVMCPHCEHDLNGLADEGVCPECGEPFSASGLAEAWSILLPRFYRRLQRDRAGSTPVP